MTPALPRPLAQRLRGIYERLRERRCRCARAEALVFHSRNQIAEYEADPHAFVETYFAQRAPDSHAVLASVQRARDALARYGCEMARLRAELAEAEAECAGMEAAVAAQLATLRGHRPARYRWPDKPHSMEMMRKQHLHHFRLRPQHAAGAR